MYCWSGRTWQYNFWWVHNVLKQLDSICAGQLCTCCWHYANTLLQLAGLPSIDALL
jgi:hypothetical protein